MKRRMILGLASLALLLTSVLVFSEKAEAGQCVIGTATIGKEVYGNYYRFKYRNATYCASGTYYVKVSVCVGSACAVKDGPYRSGGALSTATTYSLWYQKGTCHTATGRAWAYILGSGSESSGKTGYSTCG